MTLTQGNTEVNLISHSLCRADSPVYRHGHGLEENRSVVPLASFLVMAK
jgi:hypothetical protein